MIKSYYSVNELFEFGIRCLPSSYRGIHFRVTRQNWPFVEIKATGGPGGVRREYQPPAEVMAAIQQVMLDRILEKSISQQNAIDFSNEKNTPHPQPGVRSLAQNEQHGPQRDDKNQHAGLLSGGANEQQSGLRSVAVLPGNDQPTQLASNGTSLPSEGRTHGAARHGLAQVGALKDWQKRIAEARAALLREIDRIALVVKREKAINKVIAMARDGTLPAHLAQLVPVANARSGGDGKRTLSRTTLYEWFNAFKSGDVNALAPKDQHATVRIPEWASDLLACYQRPQKPSLYWAVEQITDKYHLDQDKLYHRARRFMQKMGNVELQAGRMGPRELKNIKTFIRRDSGTLWPADVYSADGHTFDAEVAHPAHGRPFRPEITAIRDIATRKLIGWSVDLAESGLAVLDAMRHAFGNGGVCSLFYVDHGSGYDNALQSAPGIGMESRLGYTKTHSLPYNSQARGVVEKGHKDIWVRAAKELPTYMGADMDAEAKNKVYKITRQDIKASGFSKRLMAWPRFLEFVEEHAERYNNHPHRGLKKIDDQVTGKKRHMTPNEAWALGVQEGAELVMLTPEESRELFRPMKEAKVLRGEIRLFNNLYFSQALTEYHGDIVRVAYDIHDANAVWVYDQQGRFISMAGFEANKRAYYPETFMAQADKKRFDGKIKRIDAKRDEAIAEFKGAPLILENNPSPTLPSLIKISDVDAVHAQVAANLDSVASLNSANEERVPAASNDAQPADRPLVFLIDSEHYEWLMQHRGEWTDADRRFLRNYIDDPQGYTLLVERFTLLDIAWPGEDAFKVAV